MGSFQVSSHIRKGQPGLFEVLGSEITFFLQILEKRQLEALLNQPYVLPLRQLHHSLLIIT